MTKEQVSDQLRAVTMIANANRNELEKAMRVWPLSVRLGAALALYELATEVRAAAIRGD